MEDGGFTQQTFEVNGQIYHSLEDVPQPHRDSLEALLADGDGDGVPDAFQTGRSSRHITHDLSRFEVDGVTYSSIDEIPDSKRSAVADALERTAGRTRSASRPAAPANSPAPIVTKAGWSGRTKLLAAFVAIDAAVVAALIWVFTR